MNATPTSTAPAPTPAESDNRVQLGWSNRLLARPEIGALVDGLTKLKRLDLVSKRAAQGENFRKLLLAVAADVRVLLRQLVDVVAHCEKRPDGSRVISEVFFDPDAKLSALTSPALAAE